MTQIPSLIERLRERHPSDECPFTSRCYCGDVQHGELVNPDGPEAATEIERLSSIRGEVVEAPWIVWSNEHRAFWGPNRCGYTQRIEKAGRYTKTEAEAICNNANYRANSTIYEGTPPEICMPAPEALANQDTSHAD